tara:strand:+ start:293 stop:487 length:195 start_codon:yes stop_codon:yes gene_type:complete
MGSNIHNKDQNEVHVASFAGGGKGLFSAAMNDKDFMKKITQRLLAQNKVNTELSQMLKKDTKKK